MEMCCGNGNGSRTKAVIGEGGLLKIKVYHLHASVQIGSFVSSKGFARFLGVGGGGWWIVHVGVWITLSIFYQTICTCR